MTSRSSEKSTKHTQNLTEPTFRSGLCSPPLPTSTHWSPALCLTDCPGLRACGRLVDTGQPFCPAPHLPLSTYLCLRDAAVLVVVSLWVSSVHPRVWVPHGACPRPPCLSWGSSRPVVVGLVSVSCGHSDHPRMCHTALEAPCDPSLSASPTPSPPFPHPIFPCPGLTPAHLAVCPSIRDVHVRSGPLSIWGLGWTWASAAGPGVRGWSWSLPSPFSLDFLSDWTLFIPPTPYLCFLIFLL